jgi:hypothetical protein
MTVGLENILWNYPCLECGILRKSGFLSARSLRTKPGDITRDLVECLAPIGRRPIRASGATVSFKLVWTRISIEWLFLFNAGIPPTSYTSLVVSADVFLPLYIDTNHADVGVMLTLCNGQCPQLFIVYYFRALCAVTEGASAKEPWYL